MTRPFERALQEIKQAFGRMGKNSSAPGRRRAWRALLAALRRARKSAALAYPIQRRTPKPPRKRPRRFLDEWGETVSVVLEVAARLNAAKIRVVGRCDYPIWAVRLARAGTQIGLIKRARRSIPLRRALLAAAALKQM